MPVLLIYGVPTDTSEEQLNSYCELLIQATCEITELNLGHKDISCFFPPDLMRQGLGEEIIIFVDGLFEKKDRTDKVRQQLATTITDKTFNFFKKTKLVECFIRSFQVRQGFFSKRRYLN